MQIPRCDLNGIRQLHKQQLKAWLSLFFLITSGAAPCIRSSASSIKCLLICICDDQGLAKKPPLSLPQHKRHSHPRPLWMRPVTLQRQMATGSSVSDRQSRTFVALCSSVITIYSQMRWYILIGRHKEHQSPAKAATHHLRREDKHEARDTGGHHSRLRVRRGAVIVSRGAGDEDKWKGATRYG